MTIKPIAYFLVATTLGATTLFAVDREPASRSRITGHDEAQDADVYLSNGKYRIGADVTQSGTWTTGRTWTLLNSTDSVNSVQSGTWTTGRTWTLLNSTDSVNAVQSGTWTVQQGTPPWTVTGNVASGSADSGNPLKIGGTFNTTQPTVTTGQRVDAQMTARGAQIVATGVDPFKVIPSLLGSKTRFDDMNVANGGVARDTGIASTTVYTTIYNYTGSGHFFTFLVNLEGNLTGADNYNVKFEIDGVTVFIIDTIDVGTALLYGLLTTQDETSIGMSLNNNVFRFVAPRPGGLYYATSVKVSVKKSSAVTSKKFRAGVVYLTKET